MFKSPIIFLFKVMASNNKLTSLIFETSSKYQQAVAFKHYLADENPELYTDLERQAKLALVGLRNHKKPKQEVDKLKTLFSWNDELDPTESGDTYGVRAFITAMSKDAHEAGKAKRFYDRTVDAFFKNLFDKQGEKEDDDETRSKI